MKKISLITFTVIILSVIFISGCSFKTIVSSTSEEQTAGPEGHPVWKQELTVIDVSSDLVRFGGISFQNGILFYGVSENSTDLFNPGEPVSEPDNWAVLGQIPVQADKTVELVINENIKNDTAYYLIAIFQNENKENSPQKVLGFKTLPAIDPEDPSPSEIFETFDDYPESGLAYQSGSFQGQSGIFWTYNRCAGASAGQIDGKTPYLGKNQSPLSELTGTGVTGKFESISFDYKQVYATNCRFMLKISSPSGEELLTALFSTDNEQGVIKHSGVIPFDFQDEAFLITFVQTDNLSGQAALDNIRLLPADSTADQKND